MIILSFLTGIVRLTADDKCYLGKEISILTLKFRAAISQTTRNRTVLCLQHHDVAMLKGGQELAYKDEKESVTRGSTKHITEQS